MARAQRPGGDTPSAEHQEAAQRRAEAAEHPEDVKPRVKQLLDALAAEVVKRVDARRKLAAREGGAV